MALQSCKCAIVIQVCDGFLHWTVLQVILDRLRYFYPKEQLVYGVQCDVCDINVGTIMHTEFMFLFHSGPTRPLTPQGVHTLLSSKS